MFGKVHGVQNAETHPGELVSRGFRHMRHHSVESVLPKPTKTTSKSFFGSAKRGTDGRQLQRMCLFTTAGVRTAWLGEPKQRFATFSNFFLNPAKFLSSRPKFLGGLELDGYCEEMSLAFEYQGEQHYDPDNYFHFGSPSSFRMQQDRDARKRELCEDFGVRLVVVPFFAKDKRTFVITSLLQWFSIGEILPKTMAAGKKARRSSDGTSTKHISIQEGPAIFFKSPSRQLCLHN